MKFPSIDFDNAVAQLCHGTVNDEVLVRLHELLQADPSARDEYLWRVEVHGKLGAGQIDFQHLSADEATADRIFEGDPRPTATALGRTYTSLAVGAALVIAIGVYWNIPSNSDDSTGEVVAQLTELNDIQWMDSTEQTAAGDSITIGERIELASGSAELRFSSGARMEVFGPAILQPLTSNSARLLMGQVQLFAETPESKGFTLQTPSTNFVDIGTAFRAAVASDGLCLLEVSEGEVDVVMQGTEVVPRVRAGESLYVEPGERGVTTRIEQGEGTPAFQFPTIAPPSSEDYADRALANASIRVVHGQFIGHSADVLLDGTGQSHQDAPQESAFFERRGGFLIDLGKAISISRINSYSWHQHETIEEHRNRAQQRFTLYGYSGDDLPDLTLRPDKAGWTRIARVNSDQSFEVQQLLDRPAQQACSITGSDGDIGQFRYLLWEVRRGTFYGEIDVYGTPQVSDN